MIKLEKYHLDEPIYENDNAIIYRGKRSEDGSPVIAKISRTQYPTRDEVSKLEREYRLVRELSHPGIIRYLDLVDFQSGKALIMEDTRSLPLTEYLRKSKPDLVTKIDIACQIADAIAYIHESGLVHRDIKSANVIVETAEAQARFIDFHLATMLKSEVLDLAECGRLRGTLSYIAPEQTGRINRPTDARSDLYSLGVTLYETLTGELPFRYTDPMELIHAHLAITPESPHARTASIPPILSDLVMKLLEKDPTRRYQSARGLEADLQTCRKALADTGEIAEFPLGREDFSPYFQLPDRIYGRESEIDLVMQEFMRAASGENRMLVFSGPPGIGKSRVIGEVRKPLAEQTGMLITGKFEQFRQDIPYSAWIQCFENLVRQLLAESDSHLREVREEILERVGDNAQIIVDLVPDIVSIIGTQKPIPELGPGENQTRFARTIVSFINVFARKGSPLVILLDDLHWADAASLSLIRDILQNLSLRNLLIITSYRSEEVTDSHPVSLFFAQLEAAGINWWQRHELMPLEAEPIASMVAETLQRGNDEVAEIAETIRKRTGSNPFFVREFLLSLRRNGCFRFEHGWQWDPDRVLATRMPDTIAEMLSERIRKFRPEMIEALQSLACMGNDIDIGFAALFLGLSPEDIPNVLASAFNEGILEKSGSQIRFSHDRIIEVLSDAMPEKQRIQEHRRIAEYMIQSLSPAEKEERLFELAHQLNAALPSFTDPEIRLKTAELDIRAGRKAFKSGAFEAAFGFYEIAESLLDADRWEQDRKFMVAFTTDYCESLYLTGRAARAEEIFRLLLWHAPDILDCIRAYEVMMTCYTSIYRLEEALSLGREALSRLGLSIPAKASGIWTAALLVRVLLATRAIKGGDIEKRPTMTAPRQLAIMRILMACTEPAYMGNPKYLGILVFHMVLRTVKYGNSAFGSYCWAGYAVVLTTVLRNAPLALRYADAALALANAAESKNVRCMVNFLQGDMIRHFSAPLKECLPYLLDSYHAGTETGNYLWASYALNNYMFYTFFKGDDLTSVCRKFERYFGAMKKFDQPHALECYRLWYQLTSSAATDVDEVRLDGELFDEKATVSRWKKNNARSALGYYTVARLIRSFFNHDWAEGIKAAERDSSSMHALLGMFFVTEYHFYLALSRIFLAITAGKQRTSRKAAQKNLALLERIAVSSPDITHKAVIIRGGILILDGELGEAAIMLDHAVSDALRSGYIQDAAIASELAAHAFITLDAQSLARACMTEAYHHYRSWGLVSKAQRLLETYDSLIVERGLPAIRINGKEEPGVPPKERATSEFGSENLDLISIIKAANVLTGTIELEELLDRLMRVVMENAGAERTLLILRDGGGYSVEAEGTSDGSIEIKRHRCRLDHYPEVPQSAIAYAARTRQRLLLNRNGMEEIFLRDAYIKARDPGSILVQPLLNQGKLVGLLYLEHMQTAKAFTSKNIQVMSMLSTQIAISVDNALLYHEQKRLTQSYSRFIPREFMSFLGKESILEIELGDQIQKHMSVMFSDMRNFTKISETMTPEDNFNFLNDYLARVSPLVRANEGFVDKYIGDAIMALFPKHPADAINAAVEIQAEVRRYNAKLPPGSPALLEIGIGIHYGSLMIGTIGERERMDTTMISDAVNVASRLESLTKTYKTPIIVSEEVVATLENADRFVCRFLDTVRLAGKDKPLSIWEIIDGPTESIRELKLASKPAFDEGLRLYRNRMFPEAAEIFRNIFAENPGDFPAGKYRDRCEYKSIHRDDEDRNDGADAAE